MTTAVQRYSTGTSSNPFLTDRFKKKERKSPIQLIHRASKRTFPCLWPRSRKRNFPADSINSLIAFPPNKSQPGHPEDLSRELSLSLPAATMPFSREDETLNRPWIHSRPTFHSSSIRSARIDVANDFHRARWCRPIHGGHAAVETSLPF